MNAPVQACEAPRSRGRGLRVLAYSPDSYGLGHVRRSVSMAKAVLGRFPTSSVLLLTGAPRAHYFEYPDRCDYLKLPSITKNDAGEYICRDLDLSLEQAVDLRGRLIQLSVESFEPDIFLVDHSPRGLCGEILPTLDWLRRFRPETSRVLGMRDVIDHPRRVRSSWKRSGMEEILRKAYDRILIYGQRDIFDPITAYGIPDDIARKASFVGYIPRNGKRAHPAALKSRYAPRTGRLVVVTLGGGGDGNLVLRSFLDGYEQLGADRPFEVAAVTGPLMSPRKRRRFQQRVRGMEGVTLVEFTDTLPDLLEAADFAVTMGGYNTVCELACAGARALIVPRSFPREEQLVRAKLLTERGVVAYLNNPQPGPRELMEHVLKGIEAPRPRRGWGLRFSGLDCAVDALEQLVGANGPPGTTRDSRSREHRSKLRSPNRTQHDGR